MSSYRVPTMLYVLLLFIYGASRCFLSADRSFLSADQHEEDYEYGDEDHVVSCPTDEVIRGGGVSYSQAGDVASVLTYRCPPGFYPYPVSHRRCGAEGAWSTMRSANGRPVSRATCKEVLCPGQVQLDNGDMSPRDQWFRPGLQVQTFWCQEGFTLSGSAQRNCTPTGLWSGDAPVCHNNQADDCADPGVPPGAHRWSPGAGGGASGFRAGDRVRYRCQAGLDLLGSDERRCLEDGEWSGAAPRCQARYVFDSPGAVAEALGGSLSGVMDVMSPQFKKEESLERSVRVTDDSRINVFLLLDTSGSIGEKAFNESRDAAALLVRRLDSYQVRMRFHVASFASEVRTIVRVTDPWSDQAEDVVQELMEFDYGSHGRKTGTNLYAALQHVYQTLAFLQRDARKNHFNETQNVIVVLTDGFSNTGLQPQVALARIRELLGYRDTPDHSDQTLLDVYVFGVGDDVNREALNGIASKKSGEKHLFLLTEYRQLGALFNSMISDESVTMCGVAQEEVATDPRRRSPGDAPHTHPWHVTITTTQAQARRVSTTCSGSLLSPSWVLTSAHCFARHAHDPLPDTVDVQHGGGRVKGKVIIHPLYNTGALRGRNVSEFYDYDVALVRLVGAGVAPSREARPICLPCTVPAGRALRKLALTSCDQHQGELFSTHNNQTAAFFVHKPQSERKKTHIHTGSQRAGCVQKAAQTLTPPTDVTLDEYVPERFLCSGGTPGHQDDISCKGDSGGSLFLQKRRRYFQVGVVTWGTTDVCGGGGGDRPSADARDFHVSVFSVMPWLKEHLSEDLQFLD